MRREDDREGFRQPEESCHCRVKARFVVDELGSVKRHKAEGANLQAQSLPGPLVSSFLEMAEQRVDHCVADEMDGRGINALIREVRQGARRVCKEDGADMIGELPVVLL